MVQETAHKSIAIVSRNIMPMDAVGNFAIELSSALAIAKINAKCYALSYPEAYQKYVSNVSELDKHDTNEMILVCSYSIYDDAFERYMDLPWLRRVVYYHNVTPSCYFRPYAPEFADILDAAQEQYPLFGKFDAAAANSIFSLEQVRPWLRADIAECIFPPYFALPLLHTTPIPVPRPETRFHLLWVGRIAPHKRPDLALRVFDVLVASGVDASLTFVGGGRYDFPKFAEHMDACIASLSPAARGRVQFLHDLSDGQLAFLYRNASLLLCTSAHEGYCMPVAEAGSFSLPVAATPQPAVQETLNGGGLILSEAPNEAARQLRHFLLEADAAARRRAVPVLRPLPTEELLRLIRGDG